MGWLNRNSGRKERDCCCECNGNGNSNNNGDGNSNGFDEFKQFTPVEYLKIENPADPNYKLEYKLFVDPRTSTNNKYIDKSFNTFTVRKFGYYNVQLKITNQPDYNKITSEESIIMYKLKDGSLEKTPATFDTVSLNDATQSLTWMKVDLTDATNKSYQFYFGKIQEMPLKFSYTLRFSPDVIPMVFADPEPRLYQKQTNGRAVLFGGTNVTYDYLRKTDIFFQSINKTTYAISLKLYPQFDADKITDLSQLVIRGERNLILKGQSERFPSYDIITWKNVDLGAGTYLYFTLANSELSCHKVLTYEVTFSVVLPPL